ncbi:MAG: hypothetical protein PHQ64_04725 [Bacilli bacterium]|nr:hypothetical protein [Bacilli bacterium]
MDIIDMKLENVIRNYMSLEKYVNLFFKNADDEEIEQKLFADLMRDDESLYNCYTLFLINNIIRIKEDVVDKIEYGVSNMKIYTKGEDSIATFSSGDPDYKFIIGTYKTNSFGEYISKIRNKLAHGDYFLDEGTCYLNIEGEFVEIPMNLFMFLSAYLSTSSNYYRKENTFQKNIIINSAFKMNVQSINLSNLDSILPLYRILNIKMVNLNNNEEISERVKDEFIRDTQYINEFLEVKDKRGLEKHLKSLEIKYLEMGVSLTFENKKIKDKELLESIKDYVANNAFFRDTYPEEQKIMLGNMIEKFCYHGYNQKFILAGNILNTMQVSRFISGKKNYGVKDFYFDKFRLIYNNYNEQLMSALIAEFHILYTCLLDDVLKENEAYKLDRTEEFDFSLLNLDAFLPRKIEQENKVISALNIQIDAKTRELEKTYGNYLDQKKCLDNLRRKNYSKEKINQVAENAGLKKRKTIDLKNKLELLKKELILVSEDFVNNKKYFENRYIIEGIRNSISHNNYSVEIDSFNNIDVNKFYIRFNDYDKDNNLVFDLNISLYGFTTLFEKENTSRIREYIEEKRKIRTNISRQYTR